MNSYVGRNDPCPCGSGKKFKKCCLGRAAHGPSINPATETLTELEKSMEGQIFSSLEELQAFTDRHMQERNQAPNDDFHGLSSEQMHRFLHFPFDTPQLVTFPETLGKTPAAPILTLFDLIVKAIGEQGLKPTAKGNLPQKLCREAALVYWGEETYRNNTEFRGINKEEDFMDLHITRLVAGLAGLIRKYKGRFILSRDCRALLAKSGKTGIYPRLLKAYTEKFNWGYWDRYPEVFLIQHSFLFTLYLLTSFGGKLRMNSFYEEYFIRAFPMVVYEVKPNIVFTQEEEVRSCYTWRGLVHFARFLGLAEVEPVTKDILCRDYRVRKLPLLQEAVQFHIQA